MPIINMVFSFIFDWQLKVMLHIIIEGLRERTE